MEFNDELQNLKRRIVLCRNRLADQLAQQALRGYETPAHVLADIREARGMIRLIKQRLAHLGCPPEDYLDDSDPDDDPVLPIDDLSSGIDLFSANPGFHRFYRTARLERVIAAVGGPPTYHVIEAAMGYGKTALVGEIWRGCSGSSGVVLAYLFSRNHGRTRVAQALRSLYQQIRFVTSLPEGLAEENVALTPAVLRSIASRVGRLTLLIDGLDECDAAERSQFSWLLPDVHLPNLSVVLTIRPRMSDLLLPFLPPSHLLQRLRVACEGEGARLHVIEEFTTSEIEGLLQMLGHQGAPDLAAQIFRHSGGVPMAAISYVQQPHLLDSAQPVVAYHERVLRYLKEQCPLDQQSPLERLLALLATARSALSLADLESLMGMPRQQLFGLRDLLTRYRYMLASGEMILDYRFRDFLKTNDTLSALVIQAASQIATWVIECIQSADLSDVSMYVLRHAAEYLAASPNLADLLGRPDWLTTLEQRSHARSECVAAIDRAMSGAVEVFRGNDGEIAVVNIILCAIVRSSLGATLTPELVAELVRFNLWSQRDAHDYAQNYASQVNRQTLAALIDDPECPISFPAGSAVAEAAASLQMLVMLPPIPQAAALLAWQRSAEQMGESPRSGTDVGLLQNLISALRQPALSGGGHVSITHFQQLITRLQSYTPPLTGAMNDPQFVDLLTEIADSWWQIPQRQLARFWIYQIVGALARCNRSDLLESLELMAPAIRTIFPRSVVDLISALRRFEAVVS